MGNPLLSLAILRVNWREQGKDYLDTFIPLIANLIRSHGYERIDIEAFRTDFKEEFGLAIPYHAAVSLLNRAKKRGLLRQHNHQLYPETKKLAEFNSSPLVREQTQKYDSVLEQFIQFAGKQFAISLEREQAENTLIAFLRDHDLDILFAADQVSLLANVNTKNQHKYLLYKFIQEAHRSQPQTFQYILDIVIGHALASTVLYGQDSTFSSGLKGTDIYLDTRLVFQLLGLEGSERQAQTTELLSLLIDQGASIKVFDHTHRELSQILDSCVEWIDRGDYDPTRASRVLRHMKENNLASADAERIALSLGNLLAKYKVSVVEHPHSSVEGKYQIDEEELHRKIDTQYGPRQDINGHNRAETIRIDVDSISAIYKLRRGRMGRTVKDSKVVFVTTNHTLAKVARDFDSDNYGKDFRIPPAVTDFFIGTTVWLQAPAKAERINEQRLLAECYAGIRPDGTLLQKYLQEVETLRKGEKVTDEEYYMLRGHRVAMNLLGDKTLGDPEAFTNRTPEEILEEIKGKIEADANTRFEDEVAQHQETRDRLTQTELDRDRIREGLERKADRWSGRTASFLAAVVGILFVGGIVIQATPGIFGQGFTVARGVLLAITLVLGGLSVVTGFNIMGLKTNMKVYLRRQILRVFGLS